MTESATHSPFWSRREEQASLGKDNGLKPFTTKVFYAAVSREFQSAIASDRFCFGMSIVTV